MAIPHFCATRTFPLAFRQKLPKLTITMSDQPTPEAMTDPERIDILLGALCNLRKWAREDTGPATIEFEIDSTCECIGVNLETWNNDYKTAAASCSRIWHGKPCGCKSFRYWLPSQGRMSYATPRKAWRPQLHNAHCTRCGDPLSANDLRQQSLPADDSTSTESVAGEGLAARNCSLYFCHWSRQWKKCRVVVPSTLPVEPYLVFVLEGPNKDRTIEVSPQDFSAI